MMIIR